MQWDTVLISMAHCERDYGAAQKHQWVHGMKSLGLPILDEVQHLISTPARAMQNMMTTSLPGAPGTQKSVLFKDGEIILLEMDRHTFLILILLCCFPMPL